MISFTIVICLLSVSLCQSHQEDLTIQYAAVIFRHGDRTPVAPYPTDPYRNESMWPVKFGQLTNTGKRQHYALGKWLRERYGHMISHQFDPNEINIRSTDVDRTLMSVEANLAGMYPPIGKSVWDDQIHWQPIPVHTVPQIRDEVLAMERKCPAYDTALEILHESKEYKDRLATYQSLMDYMTAYTGRKIKDYNDILYIFSTLNIETLYNFTLPNWTHSVYPDKMKEPACYSFQISTMTPLLARLKAGPLIQEIVRNMANTSLTYPEGYSKTVKLSVYSGHDTTIANVLHALKMFDGNCPVYTATILIELLYSQKTAEHFVRISYRNFTEIAEPYILNIPYCGELCNFTRFVTLYEKLLNLNWDSECKKPGNPLWILALAGARAGYVQQARTKTPGEFHLPLYAGSRGRELRNATWTYEYIPGAYMAIHGAYLCITERTVVVVRCELQFTPVLGASMIFSVGVLAALFVAHKIIFVRPRNRLHVVYSNVNINTKTPAKVLEA